MTNPILPFYAAGMTNGVGWGFLLGLALIAAWLSAWSTRIETRNFLFQRHAAKRLRAISLPRLISKRGWHDVFAFGGCLIAIWATLHTSERSIWIYFVCFYVGMLVTLARIDAYTGFLPDRLNYLLLWGGLLFHLRWGWLPLENAVLGAVAGYLPLRICQLLCRWFTRRDGMGQGDFKFAAALGAWCGYTELPWLLLVASGLALSTQLLLRVVSRQKPTGAIPFGPFLAVGGLWGLITCLSSLS